MTTEPPAGSGWLPPAGGYPPQQPSQPPGGQPASPHPFPASYPPPQPSQGQPGHQYPSPPPGYGYPQPPPDAPLLPDPPSAGSGYDNVLPEPPTGAMRALQWGDPTPAPAPPPRPPAPPSYSRLAVAAAVLGALLGGAGLALIVGAVALFRLRTSGKRGQQLAVLGMALTVAWAVAGGAVYYNAVANPVRNDAGVIVRKAGIKVDQLRAGDCIEYFNTSKSVSKITVIPCTSPHDAEVFHIFSFPAGDYPGDRQIDEQATKTCLDTFKTAVKADDAKNAKVALHKPVEATWKKGGRQVSCIAVQNSGTITRSIRV